MSLFDGTWNWLKKLWDNTEEGFTQWREASGNQISGMLWDVFWSKKLSEDTQRQLYGESDKSGIERALLRFSRNTQQEAAGAAKPLSSLESVPVLGDVLHAYDRLMTYGVRRPIVTSFMAPQFGSPFDSETWRKSWNASEQVTPGQAFSWALTLNDAKYDPRTPQGRAHYYDDAFFQYSSGSVDFALTFVDPLKGLGKVGKAATLAAAGSKVESLANAAQKTMHVTGMAPTPKLIAHAGYLEKEAFGAQAKLGQGLEEAGGTLSPNYQRLYDSALSTDMATFQRLHFNDAAFGGTVAATSWAMARMGEPGLFADTLMAARGSYDAMQRLQSAAPEVVNRIGRDRQALNLASAMKRYADQPAAKEAVDAQLQAQFDGWLDSFGRDLQTVGLENLDRESFWDNLAGSLQGRGTIRANILQKMRVGLHESIVSAPVSVSLAGRIGGAALRTLGKLVDPAARYDSLINVNAVGSFRYYRYNLDRSQLSLEERNELMARYMLASSAEERSAIIAETDARTLKVLQSKYGLSDKEYNRLVAEMTRRRNAALDLLLTAPRHIPSEFQRMANQAAREGRTADAKRMNAYAKEYSELVRQGKIPPTMDALPNGDRGYLALADNNAGYKADKPFMRSTTANLMPMMDYRALERQFKHQFAPYMRSWKRMMKLSEEDPKGHLKDMATYEFWKRQGQFTAALKAVQNVWAITALMRPAQFVRSIADDGMRAMVWHGMTPYMMSGMRGAARAAYRMKNRAVPFAMRWALRRDTILRGKHHVIKLPDVDMSELRFDTPSGLAGEQAGFYQLAPPTAPGVKVYQAKHAKAPSHVEFPTMEEAVVEGVITPEAYAEAAKQAVRDGRAPWAIVQYVEQLESGLLDEATFRQRIYENAFEQTGQAAWSNPAWQRDFFGALQERPNGIVANPRRNEVVRTPAPRQREERAEAATPAPRVPVERMSEAEIRAVLEPRGFTEEQIQSFLREPERIEREVFDIGPAPTPGLMTAQIQAQRAAGQMPPGWKEGGRPGREHPNGFTADRMDFEKHEEDPEWYNSDWGYRVGGRKIPTPKIDVKSARKLYEKYDSGPTLKIPVDALDGSFRFDDLKDFLSAHAQEILEKGYSVHGIRTAGGHVQVTLVRPRKSPRTVVERMTAAQRRDMQDGLTRVGQDFLYMQIGDTQVRVRNAFAGMQGDWLRTSTGSGTDTTSGVANWLALKTTSRALVLGERNQTVKFSSKTYPMAWEYTANRLVANDPIMRKALEGESYGDVLAWTDTPEGKAWVRSRQQNGVGVEDQVRDLMNMALKTVPDVGNLRHKVLIQDAKYSDLEAAFPPVKGGPNPEMPDVLGPADLLATGRFGPMEALRASIDKYFRYLNDLPIDRLIRHPFVETEYRNTLEPMLNNYMQYLHRTGESFTEAEVRRLESIARHQALDMTNRVLYDTMGRTDAAELLNLMMPFSSAVADAYFKWFRLAWKRPVQTTKMWWRFWMAPDRSGLVYDQDGYYLETDKDGNERWVSPVTGDESPKFEPDGVTPKQHEKYVLFRLPDMGGRQIFAPGGKFVPAFNKNSMNPILSVPTAGPLVAIPANQFLIGKPEMADKWWIKTFVLPFGVTSDSPLQQASPGLMRMGTRFFTENQDMAGSTAMQIYQMGMVEYAKGERDAPLTIEEAKQQAKAELGLRWFTSAFTPVAFQYYNPYKPYTDYYHMLVDKHNGDEDAAMMEFRQNGMDDYLYLTAHVSKVNYSLPAKMEAYRAFKANEELARAHPDLLGLIVGADGAGSFNKAVYEWEKTLKLKGKPVREEMTISESMDDLNKRETWSEYSKFMDRIDMELEQRGLTSLRSRGALDLAAARQQWIEDHKLNEEGTQLSGWYKDFMSTDSSVMEGRLLGMKDILSHDKLVAVRPDLQSLRVYMAERERMRDIMDQYGYKSLSSSKAGWLSDQWDETVSRLKQNLAFADLYNRWLSTDDLTRAMPGGGV